MSCLAPRPGAGGPSGRSASPRRSAGSADHRRLPSAPYIARAAWPGVSANKELVTKISTADRSAIGPLLADNIEWIEWADGVPPTGAVTRGKAAYLRNYGEDELRTEITRLVEEDNVVVAEGIVRVAKKDGRSFVVRFCNIFEIEHGQLRRKSSFGALLKPPA